MGIMQMLLGTGPGELTATIVRTGAATFHVTTATGESGDINRNGNVFFADTTGGVPPYTTAWTIVSIGSKLTLRGNGSISGSSPGAAGVGSTAYVLWSGLNIGESQTITVRATVTDQNGDTDTTGQISMTIVRDS